MEEQIRFRIEQSALSDIIMEIANRKLYDENDLFGAVRFLVDAVSRLAFPDGDEWERVRLAVELLNGDRTLEPSDTDGTLKITEADESVKHMRLEDWYDSLIEKFNAQNKKYEELERKYNYLEMSLTDSQKDLLNEGYDDSEHPLFRIDMSSRQLSSYIRRMTFDTDDDYGWLAPDGTFYPVEWGEHNNWAYDWLCEHEPDGWDPDNIHAEDNAGYFMKKNMHFLLLHNPSYGQVVLDKDDLIHITNAQRNFMFDYYEKRGQIREINALYE